MVKQVALIMEGDAGHSVAALRSLVRDGWHVLAARRTRAGASRLTERVTLPDVAHDPQAFVRGLHEIVSARCIDLLVPATEASIEAVRADDRLRRVPLLAGDPASLDLCLDKARTLAAADEAGVPTPGWVVPATRAEAHEALRELGAPLVVKPRHSWARRGAGLTCLRHLTVVDAAGLEAALDSFAPDADPGLPILQRFVEGRDLSVSVVARSGEPLVAVPVEKLSAWPVAGGKGVWRRTLPPDTPGVDETVRLLQAIGYSGVAEVEFMVGSDGVPRLMEINPRLHGYTSLPIAAGVDLPAMAARLVRGEAVAPVDAYTVGLEQRWLGGELRRLALALSPRRDGAGRPDGRRELLRTAWPPWRPGMRYDELDDLRDLGPYLPRAIRR
jgi:predicted ATP-grasp superfamily ATP-dependent carboligase